MNHTCRQQLATLRASRDHLDANQRLMLGLIEDIEADHERRVSELLAANNREVERRRAAVGALRWALIQAVFARESIYRKSGQMTQLVILIDGLKEVIAAAEAQPEPAGSGDA